MKIFNLLALAGAMYFVSCSGNKSTDANTQANSYDTISTESGLKYYYIKHGEGREVEEGSEVSTYLKLQVQDSTVWSTETSKDSAFTFFAGYDRLIKGFTEVILLLKEGDEVVAIMPDSLAYGEKGSPNFVPPNATITYNPIKVLSVSEPKLSLSKELYKSLEAGGIEAVKETYAAATGVDSSKYAGGLVEVFKLWEDLSIEERHEEAAAVATYFGNKNSEIRLKYSAVLSYESMGEFQMAMDSLRVIGQMAPNVPIVQQKMMQLQMALDSTATGE